MEINLDNLVGHISHKNIETLKKYTKLNLEINDGPITVVDVGTCAGKSAIAMASVSKKVSVITVDPTPDPRFYDQVLETDTMNQIKLIKTKSEDFYNQCPKIQGCFIDGIHNYEGVKNDIFGIVDKVESGYYVMFHDTNLYFDTIGKAVNEFEGTCYKLIEICDGEAEKYDKAASIYVARKI